MVFAALKIYLSSICIYKYVSFTIINNLICMIYDWHLCSVAIVGLLYRQIAKLILYTIIFSKYVCFCECYCQREGFIVSYILL